MSPAPIKSNLAQVLQKIHQAAQRAGRDPSTIQLIAVSKTHPPEAIDELVRCGVRTFGESRIQEAKAKVPLCSSRIQWHLIGHLQSNKAKIAVQLFEVIQSVDSLRLAEELEKHAHESSKRISILLQVNVAGEAQKFGLAPSEAASLAKEINALKHLELRGLMTIPPLAENPEDARIYFRQLTRLRNEIQDQLGIGLPELSMGMSGDYEIAIEEGATWVRVGSALFGERTQR
jgi:pyridoxal phosphate enzyme (YggS family)